MPGMGGQYHRNIQLIEGELEKQYINESDLLRENKERDNIINSLRRQIEILTYENEIVKSNPYIQRGKRPQFNIWTSQQVVEFLEKDSQKYLKEIEREKEKIKMHSVSLDSLNARIRLMNLGR